MTATDKATMFRAPQESRRLLGEFREVALDAAGGNAKGVLVEFQASDFPSFDEFQNEGVVHAQKLRDFGTV